MGLFKDFKDDFSQAVNDAGSRRSGKRKQDRRSGS